MRRMFVILLFAGGALAQSAGPTPESLSACSGHAEYSTCQVQLSDGAHDGVCLKAPRDEAPSCMPKPVPQPDKPQAPEAPPVTASR